MLLCLLMDTARFLADPTYCISGNVKDNLHEAHANTHRLTDLVGMTLLSPITSAEMQRSIEALQPDPKKQNGCRVCRAAMSIDSLNNSRCRYNSYFFSVYAIASRDKKRPFISG
jgi:hypothetical protein